MDWMLLTELSSMFYNGWPGTTAPAVSGAEPTETDLWIARQAYEFMAARTLCERCGSRFGRRLSLAAASGTTSGTTSGATWRIGVGARCRGWRRHLHTAQVSPGRDGLRFGTLTPS